MDQELSLRSLELDHDPAYSILHSGAAPRVHNEVAFRHFLNIELRRAERCGQSVVVVLVGMRAGGRTRAGLAAPVARAVFSALGQSIREVDFAGWFRDKRVAAAVLVQRTGPHADLSRRIASRVSDELRTRVRDADATLRVRVAVLRGRAEI
jgi:sugar phosphate isomerase/epimerase